jgi:hypothetical protein
MQMQRLSLTYMHVAGTPTSTFPVADRLADALRPARATHTQHPNSRVFAWRTAQTEVVTRRSSLHPWILAAGALALALSLLIGDMPVAAAATRTTFTVGATVAARTIIAASSVPAELEISARDVERGYIEVPHATRLMVCNTGPDGFALELWPVSPVFSTVTVRANGAVAIFDEAGGEIVERGLRGTALPLQLDFRFELSPGTVPGHYPWPLQFGVRPLAGDQ